MQHKTSPNHQCRSSLGFAKLITPSKSEENGGFANHGVALAFNARWRSFLFNASTNPLDSRPQTGDAWRTAINTISGSLCSSEALLPRGANPSTLNIILAEAPFQQVGLRSRCTLPNKQQKTILKL